MSLHMLATGALISDPVRRAGAKGDFATGTLRVASDDGSVLVSLISFSGHAEQLLEHKAGDMLAVAGRAKLTEWTGKDGAARHGLSLVVDQLASAAATRRADAQRRRDARSAA